MRTRTHWLFASAALLLVAASAEAQQPATDAEQVARRWQIENELQAAAIVERKVMMPMRDGMRLATDIYRPKDGGPAPVMFVRTPYNFNYWDIALGAPRDMSAALDWVKRGYVYVQQNERGKFFSEGEWDILGPPLTDGYDAIDWLSKQSWSNGRVGTVGCSSTA